MSHRDNMQLVMLNDISQSQQQGDQSEHNEEQFQNSQEMIIESSSAEFLGVQEDDRLSPSLSCPDTPLSSSNLVTTLELHPNVILGMPEDESSSGAGDGERPFMCAICHASYKTKTHLRRHMYIHMSSRPFPCAECGKGFNRKEHLNKHMEAVHSGNKHHCPYCGKQISRMDHLRRHIKNMHTNQNATDPEDKGTVLKVQVRGRKHKAQLSFLTPSFPPGTIGQTIITPIPLTATSSIGEKLDVQNSKVKDEPGEGTSNRDETSTTSMTIIPSNIIGPGQGVATLAVQSTLTQKVLVHQRLPSGSSVNLATATNGLAGLADLSLSLGGHAPLPNLCNTSSNSGGGLEDEGRGEEEEDKNMLLQMFNCGECNSSFNNEKDLTAHMRTHKPQPYRCPDCPRAYTRREKLTEHIRCVHQGQKFSCEFCGKELSRKDHVLRHIRSVHPEVYAASFAEIDESQITLDEHGRLVSFNNTFPASSGQGRKKRNPSSASFSLPSLGDVGVLLRSVCHVCLKVFGTAYHLTRHIESCHNGDVRPFSCTACNKMFKRKDHLTKHIKSHCPTLKQEQQSQANLSQQRQEQVPANSEGHDPSEKTEKISQKSDKNNLFENGQQQDPSSEIDHDGDLGMLSEGSVSSNDCHHAILQNLQVEMGVGSQDDDSIPSSSSNQISSSALNNNDGNNDDAVGGVLIGGAGIVKHSNNSEPSATEFSLAVIDSFMQGGVNVVVVDEEISNFLQQTSSAHLTTTFPCAQCQKEFPQRDQLIAHALQEHANEAMLHGHHQHIADISFPDF